MSFIGRLLGSDKAIQATVESVSKGLDALVYTDEEKALEAARERSEARSMLVEWMQSTQGQRLSRRVIALSITATWLLQYLVGQGLSFAAVWADDPERLKEAAQIVYAGSDSMSGPMMLILGFYFAAPHLSSIAGAAMDKFKDRKALG